MIVGPWDLPHYELIFYAADHDVAYLERQLIELEALVPGVLVYAVPMGWNPPYKKRLSKLDKTTVPPIDTYKVIAPLTGAWLAKYYLSFWKLLQRSERLYWCDGVYPFPTTDGARQRLLIEGCKLVGNMVRAGIVRQSVLSMATPYQFMASAWAKTHKSVLTVMPTGSGKTLATILSLHEYPVVIGCPAKARKVWRDQIRQYTTLEPFNIMPVGLTPKGSESLEDYLQRTDRPVVIVGIESLPDHLDKLGHVQPATMVLDEIHESAGDPKRWKAVPLASGKVDFEYKRTAKDNKLKRTVAVMELSRMPSISTRIGLSATPLDDGRPRRLYGPLDVLWPGGFSFSYGTFAKRYADAKPGEFGGLDDKGSSNLDELKQRASFMMHEVTYTESHSALPPTRVEVCYLDAAEQNKQEAMTREINKQARAAGKLGDSEAGWEARERLTELRIAHAASRKRRWVLEAVISGLRQGDTGGKVVVFTNRRAHAEDWAVQIMSKIAQINKSDVPLGHVDVWWGHGGTSEASRGQAVDQFKASEGPCVLVGTGQAFGTSVDGLQTADLAIFAALPWKPGDFIQWKGRFDRLGGRATLLRVPIAAGTYDEHVVMALTKKFGPISEFLAAEELAGLDEKLLGIEDAEKMQQDILAALGITI